MLSPSITFREASEPVFLLSCFIVFFSCWPLLALKPHLGHSTISSSDAGLKRVSHFGQKRMAENLPYFLIADLIMLVRSLEYSCAMAEAFWMTSIGSFLFVATLI
jgi:hypothetical protein